MYGGMHYRFQGFQASSLTECQVRWVHILRAWFFAFMLKFGRGAYREYSCRQQLLTVHYSAIALVYKAMQKRKPGYSGKM